MINEIVHKLTAPSYTNPIRLNSLVLCWQTGITQEPKAFVSPNLENVNCPKCIELWNTGFYQ